MLETLFRELWECTAGEGLPGLVGSWEGHLEEVTSRQTPEGCPGVGAWVWGKKRKRQ